MTIIIKAIKDKSLFVLSFVFTKGVVFLTPLLFAEILSPGVFGKLEYALAGLGFVLNALLNLGVPAAYPYFLLRIKKSIVKDGFNLHLAWLALVFALNQIAFYLIHIPVEYYMTINVAFIISNQVYYSTRLKTQERPVKAIFYDSGIYLVLLVLYVLFYLNLIELSINVISNFIAIYALGYFIEGFRKFLLSNKTGIFKQYGDILRYSINVMFGSFLIFLFTASGRILVEYFFSFEAVGIYAFYFRISAVSVMVYQMASILFFKKLYTLSPHKLDGYYAIFFCAMMMLSICVFFVAPFLLGPISDFFNETYEAYKGVHLILSFQMTMWIATALNSSIIDRENLAKRNNLYFLVLSIASILILLLLKESLSIELLVLVHMSIIFFSAIVQYISLFSKGILFKKSILVLTTIYLVGICLHFVF